MIRSVLLTMSLLLATTESLQCEANIQRFLDSNQDYQFVMESETPSAEKAPKEQNIDTDLLAEAGFTSYSRWNVIPQSGSPVRVDIYEVTDPIGAFQIFSHWPEPESDLINLESPISARLSRNEGIFWRGRFFFRITQPADPRLPLDTFSSLVNFFYEAISQENLLPVSVTHLPEQDRLSSSVRFYLGEMTLKKNTRFPEPLLAQIGLADRIEIAFAEYGETRDPLFIVGYPTVALAKQYIVSMQQSLQGFFSEEGVYIKRTGILIGIFVGPEQRAQEVLARVKYQPKIQWLYEKKPESKFSETLTFLGLITQTIIGIGIFLVLIMGTGLSFGLVRYEIIRRFPEIFRKEKIVRLELEVKEHEKPK